MDRTSAFLGVLAVLNLATLVGTVWFLWTVSASWPFWILLYLSPTAVTGVLGEMIAFFVSTTPREVRLGTFAFGLSWPAITAIGLLGLLSKKSSQNDPWST